MAQKAVIDAVADRLAAYWTLCPVWEANTVTQPPADGSGYLEIQYPVTNSQQISIGAPGQNWLRDEGVIRAVFHIESGTGLSVASTWSDTFAALFRLKQFDGVQTWAPSSPAVDDDNDNGNYFVVSVAVPYWFDYLG
ncbi:phage tail terminator-like protein [Ancylobacter defluvii]|uniref:Uncharacterized protein n=1 Tax=Ancylobacter defluvii TaxID=1282440 RepID=A0A9W6JZB9_9HYPH|nr:phage tail terminator-like protein [Ancylobacter defluvii]MBS7588290.1 hypothetical protein [Ancylobacter defluvii]GLK86686.1 hypothetical protein GCM10017653_47560 [Ancylobacter defluvii]